MLKSVVGYKTVFVTLMMIGWCASVSHGQTSSAAQDVSVTVSPIVVMAVFGQPGPFTLDRMQNEGDQRLRDLSSFYNMTTNVPGVIISAEIDAPMPAGTSLFLSAETTLGTSHGPVDLSLATSATQVLSSIAQGLENNRRFEYEFRADASVESLPFQSRTVLLSLLNPATGISSQFTQTLFFEVISGTVSAGER